MKILPYRYAVVRAIHAEALFTMNWEFTERAGPVTGSRQWISGQGLVPFPREDTLFLVLGLVEWQRLLRELRGFVVAIHRHQRCVAGLTRESEMKSVGIETNFRRLMLQRQKPGRVPIGPAACACEPHDEPRLAQARGFDQVTRLENLRALLRGDGCVGGAAQARFRHVSEE